LRESEFAACRALLIARQLNDKDDESKSLYWLGVTIAVRGKQGESARALDRSLKLAHLGIAYRAYDYQAIRALWFGEYDYAQVLADLAMTNSEQIHYERGIIRAARLQGEVTLGMSDLSTAGKRLIYALARARMFNLVDEELPSLIGLSELRRKRGDRPAMVVGAIGLVAAVATFAVGLHMGGHV